MRLILLAALALVSITALAPTSAEAVVCARGVFRAGCAGPNGAVVVHRPVVVCHTVWVGGVRVRRCG
jgi:hypothetical protein